MRVNKRSAVLYVNGTDYTDSVSDARIVSAESDSDFVTFAQAAAGGARAYTLNMTLVQDPETTSLWYYAWNEAGQTHDYELWPNGRPATGIPTPTQPRFAGDVVVSEPDGDLIGGEADKSTTAFQTIELAWSCVGKPVRSVA